MPPHDDSDHSQLLIAARTALEAGDLAAATRQVATVLGDDPNRADALGLLDEIIAAAADPLELVPDDDLPLPSNLQAVQAYLLADQERLPEAVDKLLNVIVDRPDVLYIDWLLGWLQQPEAAGQVAPERFIAFLQALLEQYPALTAPHGGGRDTLARVPLFIQLVRRTQPANADFLSVAVALLARLGNLDEALRLAREAHALEPGLVSVNALAGTYVARQELEAALRVYREAIDRDPTDVSLRLALADLLAQHDRLKEAQEVYTEVLDQEPNQEVAKPSLYFLRYVTEEEETWRDQLFLLAEEQPENERAQRLAQQLTPYLGHLPSPPDLTASLRKAAEGPGSRRATLPYLEAPSNYLAFSWLANLDVTVLRVQKPDPRLPRKRVDYLLWRFDGVRPQVAVPPPEPEVSQAVARLASQPYHFETWCNHARRQARLLGPDKLDDLLASLVYPLGVGQTDRPALWTYRLQVAGALAIAYLDEGWRDSVRRKALLALANGPMDWTVDAALVALAAVAREEPEAVPEIHALFRELRQTATPGNHISYFAALLWCSLLLPDLPDEERADIRQQLRAWQDSRQAERHQRQAQLHLEKGEVDRAIEALAETVRLDPGNAEAYRERAALALRRGDASRALADFTEALRLQPKWADVYLGRGQAHLKLGQLGKAIDDFTEAVRLAPWDWQPWYRRGLVRLARKDHEAAVEDFSEAIRLGPELTEPYLQRALANARLGRDERAIRDYTELIRLNPGSPLAYNFRGRLYLGQGKAGPALADHLKACELDPGNANTYCQLAWIWATFPDGSVRDARRALEAARKACELTDWKKARCLDALAAASAEAGQFAEAARYAEQAVVNALEVEKRLYAERLERFQKGQPWREGATGRAAED